MPITFDRINTLLVDLERAINCFDELRQRTRGILSATQLDAQSKLGMIDNALVECPKPPRAVAEYERKYYNSNKRRNERMRDKQRARRRNSGVLERHSALPSVIMSEVEAAQQVDDKRYEIPAGEEPEVRQERALILAHDRAQEIFKARGPFPRSALLEFAMGINRPVEQLVEDLLDKGWLETEDGRTYTPLTRDAQPVEETANV